MFKHPDQQGFTLIEVLIAFVILSFGLLGAVALQAKAKQASFDALQRSAAIALGNDIIQRMRANDSSGFAGLYNGEFSSESSAGAVQPCLNARCSAQQIAAFDKQQWIRAIQARENTGALDDATVCISSTPVAAGSANEFNIQVVISWRGRQELSASKENNAVKCGAANDKRRLVVLDSYIYLRS
ncbi:MULTISPECIES: type IV pilus modification protein PilV [unclassified Pseudoalteromonas]|uniref:type IV pilus modification protein PilV n=1 Tax=unclassified Pseudoalteromonas TaxID=194690 RepID=UPI000C98822D|nr:MULTISPECIES: type IV pilus modification protein PilV [unclassified Pseudoalteromonas]MAD05222.1 type IV pilus modification protein PilV [Pseudoalteromonas sp.]MCG9709972.1 type IV pilus modification protein PilV [Pseudoalteromonas sp. Isolate3]RZD23284.1 type IV pilus modification protein PilV [Pseudoalteromonas sp. MEBiC 03485]|tara:strand:+ start:9394 stop:9948 length:555 start_codon:yes stop_codon:yes gene_type:complete